MTKITIEQQGGLAGLGDSASALTRTLNVDPESLIPGHKRLIDQLFEKPENAGAAGGDQITFKISRELAGSSETIVVNESDLPTSLQAMLKLDFR